MFHGKEEELACNHDVHKTAGNDNHFLHLLALEMRGQGVIGEGGRRGAIAAGLAADLVVLDADLALEQVLVAGRRVR